MTQIIINSQLLTDFNINASHDKWCDNDDEYADRLYRLMNNDKDPKYATEQTYIESAVVFLNNVSKNDINEWMSRSDYGVIYMVAKRIIYKRFKQLNDGNK